MTKQRKKEEGSQFVRYFGPILDALRALGGSGTPDEVVERIALDLGVPDEVRNELLPSRSAALFVIRLRGRGSILSEKDCLTHPSAESGALQSVGAKHT